MIDEEDRAQSHEGDALLYDYFKHLTSLCIFSLGGVLALAEKASDGKLLIGVIAVIGTAALLSFGATGEIVEARFKGRAPNTRHLNIYRVGSPALLSVGLGMFLYIFLGTMTA